MIWGAGFPLFLEFGDSVSRDDPQIWTGLTLTSTEPWAANIQSH